MMTLDEAIEHAEEVAKEKRYEVQDCLEVHDMESAMECGKCGEEHEQLAEWLKELKQLKEQKPCEDAISRSSVFEIMGNLMSIPYDLDRPINKKDVSESMDEIRVLPPVTPTQNWIPVSERLPEPNRAVLTYVNTGKSETFCLANWNDACGDWEEWIGTRMLESEMEYKVLAWMPLPKPYQAEKESEE